MSRRRLFWHMTSPVLVSNPRQLLTLPFHTCRFPFVHAMHDREALNCNGKAVDASAIRRPRSLRN